MIMVVMMMMTMTMMMIIVQQVQTTPFHHLLLSIKITNELTVTEISTVEKLLKKSRKTNLV